MRCRVACSAAHGLMQHVQNCCQSKAETEVRQRCDIAWPAVDTARSTETASTRPKGDWVPVIAPEDFPKGTCADGRDSHDDGYAILLELLNFLEAFNHSLNSSYRIISAIDAIMQIMQFFL